MDPFHDAGVDLCPDSVKSMPLTPWTRISPFFGSLCCSSNSGTAFQGPGKGSGARQDHGQPWGHLTSVTPALAPHWAVETSHLQCDLETWIAPLVQSTCVLLKEHRGKRHPKSNTCSQVSAGTAPEPPVGVRKGAGISAEGMALLLPFANQVASSSCKWFYLVLKIKSTQFPLNFPAGAHVIKISTELWKCFLSTRN